jgi:hypothetical protein
MHQRLRHSHSRNGGGASAQPIARQLDIGAGRLSPVTVAIGALASSVSHAAKACSTERRVSPGSAFDDTRRTPASRLGSACGAIGAACGEELFFRGFLRRGLSRAGRGAAITSATVAFGAAHGDLVRRRGALGSTSACSRMRRIRSVASWPTPWAARGAVRVSASCTYKAVATPLVLASMTLACIAPGLLRSVPAERFLQSPPGSAD